MQIYHLFVLNHIHLTVYKYIFHILEGKIQIQIYCISKEIQYCRNSHFKYFGKGQNHVLGLMPNFVLLHSSLYE